MFPKSWIIRFDSGQRNDWFCRRSSSRACRTGWFSIFWINSRTLVLCACFTTECGSPGIRKSLFASFTMICSWLKWSWSAMDLSVLLRNTSSSTLNVSLSWEEHTRELSCASAVLRVATGLSVLSWVCSTLRLLLSRDERVWITSVSTGRTVLSEELSSSQKELTLVTWERYVFLACYKVAPISHELDLELVVLVGNFLLVELLLLMVVEQLHLLVVEQLPNPILFSIRVSRRSLAEAEVTCILFRKRISSVHPNNFWDTISRKCFLKNDRIRSSLIECQSFLNSKIDFKSLPSGPCDFCQKDQQAGRILSITCSTLTSSINPEVMIEGRLKTHPIC